MIQILYILFGMVIILFILSIAFAVAPDKKEKEEKPIDKTPVKIEIQFEYEGYLYTLYTDGTWEIDITLLIKKNNNLFTI